MRVGLDLDGLLDERPDFFAFLSVALKGLPRSPPEHLALARRRRDDPVEVPGQGR
jgi:hypothetical protein